MTDFDSKVYEYTLQFTQESGVDVDPVGLRNGINRHLNSARTVVTHATLERIGYQYIAVMINTAARYDLSLAEVLMASLRDGIQPLSATCATLRREKDATNRVPKKPRLTLIKS